MNQIPSTLIEVLISLNVVVIISQLVIIGIGIRKNQLLRAGNKDIMKAAVDRELMKHEVFKKKKIR